MDPMRNGLWIAGAALIAPALMAAGLSTLSLGEGSRVWVQGTSSVRSYRCESAQVGGTVDAGSTRLADLAVGGARITIPVASLDCRNNTMNGHMRTALKAPQAPTISFLATDVRVSGGTARLTGDLSIAGQTRPVSIDATVAEENGRLRVRGSKAIVMTEWGVRPPSLMMGTMRVSPNATVGFDVLLQQ